MEWTELESIFSAARVGRYKARCHGNERFAMAAYHLNLLLSEALTPFLSTFEIALRNAVHRQLCQHHRRDDWWECWRDDLQFQQQLKYISQARRKLTIRNEVPTPDKIVAELTFGFWSTLFNAEFHASLWPRIRKAFPHCPKARRKRATISGIVNRIRHLRNRTFHHEPLLWIEGSPEAIHQDGMELLQWIHGGIGSWVAMFNRVPLVWWQWKALEAALCAVPAHAGIRIGASRCNPRAKCVNTDGTERAGQDNGE